MTRRLLPLRLTPLSSFALAAGHAPAFFPRSGLFSGVTVLLVVAALIAYVCFRLGLAPHIGFPVAGVVIGPNAPGLGETLTQAVWGGRYHVRVRPEYR